MNLSNDPFYPDYFYCQQSINTQKSCIFDHISENNRVESCTFSTFSQYDFNKIITSEMRNNVLNFNLCPPQVNEIPTNHTDQLGLKNPLDESFQETEMQMTKNSNTGEQLSQIINKIRTKGSLKDSNSDSDAGSMDEDEDEDGTAVKLLSKKKKKTGTSNKGKARYDEPMKNIKNMAFKYLVIKIITENEKACNKNQLEKVKIIFKVLREIFIKDVTKESNYKTLNMSIMNIINEIFTKKLPQMQAEYSEAKKEQREKGKKLPKDFFKKYFFIEDSLKINIFPLEKFFKDEKSIKILNKSYFQVISEFKMSEYFDQFLYSMINKKTKEYVINYLIILDKYEDYLKKEKVPKIFNKQEDS